MFSSLRAFEARPDEIRSDGQSRSMWYKPWIAASFRSGSTQYLSCPLIGLFVSYLTKILNESCEMGPIPFLTSQRRDGNVFVFKNVLSYL
jgi:hypothetical protein